MDEVYGTVKAPNRRRQSYDDDHLSTRMEASGDERRVVKAKMTRTLIERMKIAELIKKNYMHLNTNYGRQWRFRPRKTVVAAKVIKMEGTTFLTISRPIIAAMVFQVPVETLETNPYPLLYSAFEWPALLWTSGSYTALLWYKLHAAFVE